MPFVKRSPMPCGRIPACSSMARTFGGAFKATKNLARDFPGRVLDAPISEDAIIGLAVGAAIEGLRPIIEMQFAYFCSGRLQPASVYEAATLFWRTNVPCPITVGPPGSEHDQAGDSEAVNGLVATGCGGSPAERARQKGSRTVMGQGTLVRQRGSRLG